MARSAQHYTACLSSLLLAASVAAAGHMGAPSPGRSTSPQHLVLAPASPIVLM